MKTILNHKDILDLVEDVRLAIIGAGMDEGKCYPIPRGGVAAAYAVHSVTSCPFTFVDRPEDADFFIDDLIDSGETMKSICDAYPGKPFFALIDKKADNLLGKWIVFPWEVCRDHTDDSASDIVTRLLQFVGEDPNRGGLLETPHRVLKAWRHWTSGYSKDPKALLKVFEDGAESYDEMVIVKDIPLYSHCEHHLAPIVGTVSIAYIPNATLRTAETAIRAAYEAKDIEACYTAFNTAYTFTPITGAEWRALKSAGQN